MMTMGEDREFGPGLNDDRQSRTTASCIITKYFSLVAASRFSGSFVYTAIGGLSGLRKAGIIMSSV